MRLPTIKTIRWLLIGLIGVILLAVLLNLWHFRRIQPRAAKKAPAMISLDLKRSAESIEIFERRGSDLRFKIRARRLRETRLDKSILEGIEASDFNPDGSLRNSILSDEAVYDQAKKIADFSGNVRMFLGKDIELRTPSLHYDLNTSIGTASGQMKLISKNATGTARGIRFLRDKEILELHSAVDFVLTQRSAQPGSSKEPETIHAVSDQAVCSFQSNRITFSGNVRMESIHAGNLRGDRVELGLSPDHKRVTSLTSFGQAAYEFKDASESRTLSGDTMTFVIGKSEALEKIKISGRAALYSKAQGLEQSLNATEILLTLDPATNAVTEIAGQIDVKFLMKRGSAETHSFGDQLIAKFAASTKHLTDVDVRGHQARLSMTGGREPGTNDLDANEIHARFRELNAKSSLDNLQAENSVRWSFTPQPNGSARRNDPARTLAAAKLLIQYSVQGDYPDSGNASGKVVLTENLVKSSSGPQMRRLESDSLQFHFFPQDTHLRDMNADGHVQTTYIRTSKSAGKAAVDEMHTSSEHLSALFAVKDGASTVASASQWGNFRYRDSSNSATSGRCEYDAQAQLLTLKESPKITDARSSTTGEQMEYDLKEKVLHFRKKVRSVLSAQKSQGAFFQSSDASSPAIIVADEMRYWRETGRFQYSGRVQALTETQQLQADVLDIAGKGDRMEANGNIRHLLLPKDDSDSSPKASSFKGAVKFSRTTTTIQAGHLEYSRDKNTVVYSANVALKTKDLTLTSDSLDGVLDAEGKAIKHALARGKVVLRQQARTCRGDSADWDPDTSTYVILGNPAEVDDPGRGRSFARRLTYFQADDRIVLEK